MHDYPVGLLLESCVGSERAYPRARSGESLGIFQAICLQENVSAREHAARGYLAVGNHGLPGFLDSPVGMLHERAFLMAEGVNHRAVSPADVDFQVASLGANRRWQAARAAIGVGPSHPIGDERGFCLAGQQSRTVGGAPGGAREGTLRVERMLDALGFAGDPFCGVFEHGFDIMDLFSKLGCVAIACLHREGLHGA
ncbi:hypothetical protein GB937_010660 [Aspergillus fischeri]|nr:hypothetical protein GB937_010660 [Aspergillus fischeri]